MKEIILHIPHSGVDYPTGKMGQIIDLPEMIATFKHLTDWRVDELFGKHFNGVIFKSNYTRCWCDVERLEVGEPMEDKGMGIIYTKGVNGVVYREVGEADRVNWEWISIYQKLSEPFIREFTDKVDLYYISKYQKISIEFQTEFVDKLRRYVIAESWHYK